MRPHRFYKRPEESVALLEGPRRANAARLQFPAQAQARIGHQRLGRALKQRQIGRIVAYVIELARAKAAAQSVELAVAGQVDGAVAAQYAGEDAQMLSHAPRQPRIGARGQVKRASTRAFLRQEGEQLAIIRQVGNVQLDLLRHVRLEGGFAVKQAPSEPEDPERPRARHRQQRVHQRVRFHQRSVQVDT